jgi:hypothetical protein
LVRRAWLPYCTFVFSSYEMFDANDIDVSMKQTLVVEKLKKKAKSRPEEEGPITWYYAAIARVAIQRFRGGASFRASLGRPDATHPLVTLTSLPIDAARQARQTKDDFRQASQRHVVRKRDPRCGPAPLPCGSPLPLDQGFCAPAQMKEARGLRAGSSPSCSLRVSLYCLFTST